MFSLLLDFDDDDDDEGEHYETAITATGGL